jgi:hypothetical protein
LACVLVSGLAAQNEKKEKKVLKNADIVLMAQTACSFFAFPDTRRVIASLKLPLQTQVEVFPLQ